MCKIAEQDFLNKNFVETAYFEPFYLKDFLAGKPKIKGLK
jgi:tRNA threonylcarbamoyladenosine biosynthesis protein TsaB